MRKLKVKSVKRVNADFTLFIVEIKSHFTVKACFGMIDGKEVMLETNGLYGKFGTLSVIKDPDIMRAVNKKRAHSGVKYASKYDVKKSA